MVSNRIGRVVQARAPLRLELARPRANCRAARMAALQLLRYMRYTGADDCAGRKTFTATQRLLWRRLSRVDLGCHLPHSKPEDIFRLQGRSGRYLCLRQSPNVDGHPDSHSRDRDHRHHGFRSVIARVIPLSACQRKLLVQTCNQFLEIRPFSRRRDDGNKERTQGRPLEPATVALRYRVTSSISRVPSRESKASPVETG
jgi:hypothetical protein